MSPAAQRVASRRIRLQGGEPQLSSTQPARILVVDDEENLRNILVFQLRGEGHEVRGLARGDEVLPTALSWKPELVLLDLMMPGMDGFAVSRALRANAATATLPIIVVTARGDAGTKLQALVAGAHDFLVKPYAWEELLLRIQSTMELSQRHAGQRSFTGLPGSAATESEIVRLMNSEEDFAFLSLDIDHFKRFNENFGYERGDEVLEMLARVVNDVLDERETKTRFAGHLGGDDFVVLVDTPPAKAIADALIARFDTESRGFFPPRDLERGYFELLNRGGRREMVPLLALTVAVVENVRGRELHVRRLADLAAELRRYGKSRPGSIVVTERRR